MISKLILSFCPAGVSSLGVFSPTLIKDADINERAANGVNEKSANGVNGSKRPKDIAFLETEDKESTKDSAQVGNHQEHTVAARQSQLEAEEVKRFHFFILGRVSACGDM